MKHPHATHDEGATHATKRRTPGRPIAVAALLVAFSLTIAALVWHVTALEAYISAGRPYDPTMTRLAAAQTAVDLEPWNDRFAWRLIALRGLDILERGDVDGAYFLLDPYIVKVHGTDATFVAVYQQIVTIKTPLDARKAHLAHGAERYNSLGPITSEPATPSVTPTGSVPSTVTTP